MAVDKYGGEDTHSYSWGTGTSQAYVWAEVTNKDDDTSYVHVKGCVSSKGNYRISQYGVHVQSGQNGSNQWTDTAAVFDYNNWVGNIDSTWEVAREKNDKSVNCWTKYWGEEVGGIDAGSWAGSVSVDVTVPKRQYHEHGTPTLTTIKTTAHYGETITLSFAKSETQGNANFKRFELYQGTTKLYSGTDTSYTVTPSDVTGAVGGTATYTLKEVHEWYDEYPSKETSISIKVQSGVVTIYDENRVKHVGLVTMYDEQRVKHYVLITAYDENGKAHNVV